MISKIGNQTGIPTPPTERKLHGRRRKKKRLTRHYLVSKGNDKVGRDNTFQMSYRNDYVSWTLTSLRRGGMDGVEKMKRRCCQVSKKSDEAGRDDTSLKDHGLNAEGSGILKGIGLNVQGVTVIIETIVNVNIGLTEKGKVGKSMKERKGNEEKGSERKGNEKRGRRARHGKSLSITRKSKGSEKSVLG
jgi:hypothetical protein